MEYQQRLRHFLGLAEDLNPELTVDVEERMALVDEVTMEATEEEEEEDDSTKDDQVKGCLGVNGEEERHYQSGNPGMGEDEGEVEEEEMAVIGATAEEDEDDGNSTECHATSRVQYD